MAGSYDLFVIGAGPGGYVPALEAARAGYRVAVAERDLKTAFRLIDEIKEEHQ